MTIYEFFYNGRVLDDYRPAEEPCYVDATHAARACALRHGVPYVNVRDTAGSNDWSVDAPRHGGEVPSV